MPSSVVVDPLNGTGQQTTSTVYDFASGIPTSVTDPNSRTTFTSYTNQLLGAVDPFGRPGVVTDPQGRTTVTRYRDNARQLEVWSDLNSPSDAKLRSLTSADQLGRAIKTESSEDGGLTYGVFSESVYQQMGRITITTNPLRAGAAPTDGWTRATKDDLGRVVTVETFSGRYPSGTSTGVVTTSYNANQTTVTDQAGKVRRSVTDALGRLVRVDEPDSTGSLGSPDAPAQPTSYTYDSLGNLTRVEQGSQPARTFVYDALSRLKQANNPESGVISYTYDDNSNLFTKTDARGVVTTFVYDGLNRVVSKTHSGPAPGGTTPAVSYVYDTLGAGLNGKGRLTSVSSSVSSYSYGAYDVMGRVLSGKQTTDSIDYTMSYQYNVAGGMTSETYPSGKVVATEYDAAGRMAGVRDQASGAYYAGGTAGTANAMAYTAHGAVAAVRLGNGKWEHTNFNSRLQPTVIGLGATSVDSSLLRLDYSFGTTNNNGNVLSQRIVIAGSLDVTQSYTYDELNRLKTAGEVGWSQTYDFDRYGNRAVRVGSFMPNSELTPQSASATDLSAFDQANNRLRQATFPNVLYDVAGNLTRDQVGSTFTYDGENRQITSSVGGVPASYFYDGDGHRVKKVVGPVGSAVTTVFVYNAGGQLVAEYTNSTSPPSGGGGTSYLTSDHLSSTRVVTKADGTVKARYDYLPFGEELPTDKRPAGIGYGGSDGTKQKFTQKERDDESGLDYFLARYYSSAQGRFTSVDPLLASATAVNAQSWNRYSYTINNPLKYVDGSGMIWGLLKTNFGSRYWWYEDEEALKAAGATEVTANALGAHVYQAEGGAWIRLDLGQNRWRAYDREFEAQFGRTLIEEGSSHDGDLGLTLDLFFVAQGGVGVARLGAGAFTRIFTGAGSELTTLGLSGGANTFGRTGTTPLFRAVMQGELDDIMSTQAFRNPAELEVKYFSETANGAASYARQSSRAFGDGPFTLVETRIPTNLINNSMRSTVDGGIRTLVVQTELLPLLSRPRIWSYTPLPAK